MTLQAAEDLSGVLRKALPVANPMVDHYISQNVWDQAILESLATFVAEKVALPTDVRQMVEEFINREGMSPNFYRFAAYNLERIPV